MTHLNLEQSLIVSDQIKTTCSALDNSISELAALTGTVVAASRASELAPAASQKILQAMASSVSQVIEGRADFVSAHAQMITLKQKSDHAETDFGCWGDGPLVNPLFGKLKAVV
ncbi:hypothetical protein MNBD_ALPHA04-314 [hydrothermal vent metagenome]|uniref:Uncharacterized protein n=1 Tax=hydrothermal vent metagenome TaxID=652676 RepID=A0A3B0R5Y1_9ZZZZ